jgi:hypothetical protein
LKVLECKKIDVENYNSITYIRIDPENLSVTIRDIITSLSNLSWIAKFDKSYIRNSFFKRAEDTAEYLADKILKDDGDKITEDSGEYVVSELAREALVIELKYLDVPLAELFKEQVSGNPGFDFYSANKEKVIIFGEAKYSSGRNAYGIGMEQVDRFIREGQDVSDLNDIDKFFEEESLKLADKGDKAYAIAFAAKGTASDMIIKGIIRNKHYKDIAINKEVIFLAVNV